jgi:hypothetical protein
MEFGPVKFQQGAIGVAEADFAGKSGHFGVVGGNIGGGVAVAVLCTTKSESLAMKTNYIIT